MTAPYILPGGSRGSRKARIMSSTDIERAIASNAARLGRSRLARPLGLVSAGFAGMLLYIGTGIFTGLQLVGLSLIGLGCVGLWAHDVEG